MQVWRDIGKHLQLKDSQCITGDKAVQFLGREYQGVRGHGRRGIRVPQTDKYFEDAGRQGALTVPRRRWKATVHAERLPRCRICREVLWREVGDASEGRHECSKWCMRYIAGTKDEWLYLTVSDRKYDPQVNSSRTMSTSARTGRATHAQVSAPVRHS